MAQDLRYALRRLVKTPGFTLVALFTLALGIGANSAVFSLMNAVLFRPLPFDHPDRLVLIWESSKMFGLQDSPVAPANFTDWRIRSRSFEEMGALEDKSYRRTGQGTPEMLYGGQVTAGLLRALRIQPMIGRIFRDEEDRPGTPKVALIGELFWRNRMSADPHIAGKTITLDDGSYTIVGVLAAGSEPPVYNQNVLGDIWTSFGSAYTVAQLADRGRHNWMVLARLRDGISLPAADAEIRTIGTRLAREYPETNREIGAFVAPLRDHFTAGHHRLLWTLFGTVALILLIACANMANLLLSRAIGRSKELAVRTAMGASPWRITRQFLCESLLLCLVGGALGLLSATPTLRLLVHLAPSRLTGLQDLSADWRVIGFTLAMSMITAIVFAFLPLLQIRRADTNHLLKQSARSVGVTLGSRRFRSLLICSEVALAFILLIGAGLLLRTFMLLRGTEVGCRMENVLTMRMPLYTVKRTTVQTNAFQREVLQRVQAIPGVISAGFTNHIPLAVKGDITSIRAEGYDEKTTFQCNHRVIGPGYLQTMNISIRRGRDVEEHDDEKAPRVVWINETLARTLWPDQDPIGRRIRISKDVWIPVVGVVADVRQSGLDMPPKQELYFSSLQSRPLSLAVHTQVDPHSMASAVRQAIWVAAPDLPITDLADMEQVLDRELSGRRLQTSLLAAMAGLGLLLAMIGIYGILAYLVEQQTAEIGIRMALGAGSSGILRSVMGRCLRWTMIGMALGVVGAVILSRFLAGYLYGVKPIDPLTYGVTAIVLLLTATLACYLPARRASKVDPIVALRCD